MQMDRVKSAVVRAHEFLRAALAFESEMEGLSYYSVGTKKSGALRRASMDLTRALAEMRKGPNE